MGKIYITVLVLYVLFAVLYLFRLRLEKRRYKDIVGKGSSISDTGNLKTDIVGKSKFDENELKPVASKAKPLTATLPENEKETEKPDTFVPSNEEKLSARVPAEELDEVFSDTPSEEENKPMDIDYPLEYESNEENETEDEEGEEIEGMAGAALASGVRFEDLGNAIRTINKKEEATSEQKKAAGDTLLEIRQTDMFEQVVSGKPEARETVTFLMNASLKAFHKRKDKEVGNIGSDRKAPENFNIRDFT